jgi:hypothetical protein
MLASFRRSLCTLLTVAFVAAQSPAFGADAQPPISDKARAHFGAGVSYMQDPDGARYEEAYREFKAAYADSPSWKILGNLGIAAMKLERDGEAITAYESYLSQGGDQVDADERAQMKRDLETLRAGVVTITINVTPEGSSIIDERLPVTGSSITNDYGVGPAGKPLKLGVRAGHHRIRARLAGFQDQVWDFEAVSGTQQPHTFQLVAAAAAPGTATSVTGDAGPTRPVPISVYVGAGVTGAFTVGAVVTGLLATSKHSQFQTANDGSNPAHAKALRDSGQTLNLVNDVLVGGAVVAAGVTAVLYFARPRATSSNAGLMLSPEFARNRAALSLTGSF